MQHLFPLSAPGPMLISAPENSALFARIRAEFDEMPGMKLTLQQAARLFDLQQAPCERVLDDLVKGGVLSNDGGVFSRTRDSRR
jgi:hypothetical protein